MKFSQSSPYVERTTSRLMLWNFKSFAGHSKSLGETCGGRFSRGVAAMFSRIVSLVACRIDILPGLPDPTPLSRRPASTTPRVRRIGSKDCLSICFMSPMLWCMRVVLSEFSALHCADLERVRPGCRRSASRCNSFVTFTEKGERG